MSGAKHDIKSWPEVMPRIIDNLGLNVEEVRYELSELNMDMSAICNACVKFKNGTNGRSEKLSMVIKRPPPNQQLRELLATDAQFNNEIVFYQMYAEPGDNFSRCCYAKDLRPLDTLIALENVSGKGYRNCPYNYDPPLDYTLAAMRELGRFHGKGYVMKEQQPERFFDIAGRLEETRYVNKSPDGRIESFVRFVDDVALRVVEQLRCRGYDTVFCDKMEALLSNAYERVMLKITHVSPSEPLSTLCHGDFTLNNILFKTESDGQHRAMLIDFALLRYGTPVIDLSTYFYLHCSYETRRDKFFDIMKVYHDALKEYLHEAGIRNVERYSYQVFLDNYSRGSFFGFIIASFFLASAKGYDIPMAREMVKDEKKFTIDLKKAGGDEVSKELADMVLEMKELGYLKHVL